MVDVATVKAAAGGAFSGLDDAVIDRCIYAATAEIERAIFPRRIVQDTYTLEAYDGGSAVGRFKERIYLDQYPIITLTQVKENGAILVAGSGYDASGAKDVQTYMADGILVRKSGTSGALIGAYSGRVERAWAAGLQNIEVTYDAGFADPLTEAPDIAGVCIELAVIIYRTDKSISQSSQSRQSGNVSYIKQLPDRAISVISQYAPWGRPKCRLGA